MKIKSEILQVKHIPYAPDGSKIEPEQQPAARIIQAEAPVDHAGAAVGTMPTRIVVEMNAGALADKLRSMCRSCKHFKRKRWQKLVEAADSPLAPLEERSAVNRVREALLFTDNAKVTDMHTTPHPDNDFDVEHALYSLGICTALTEYKKRMVVVHPLSSCPIEVATPERQQGFYEPRSTEADRQTSAHYDEVMRAAQGKLSK